MPPSAVPQPQQTQPVSQTGSARLGGSSAGGSVGQLASDTATRTSGPDATSRARSSRDDIEVGVAQRPGTAGSARVSGSGTGVAGVDPGPNVRSGSSSGGMRRPGSSPGFQNLSLLTASGAPPSPAHLGPSGGSLTHTPTHATGAQQRVGSLLGPRGEQQPFLQPTRTQSGSQLAAVGVQDGVAQHSLSARHSLIA